MSVTPEIAPSLSPGIRMIVTITDIAFGGEGVARWNDFVIFVPFVVNGEEVEVEIIEVKKRFARAKLLKVLAESPQRTTPRCRYFGECGGCQYQHIDYALQLQIKHKQIADLFQRVGKIPADRIAPVIPCPQPYSYRNRIMIRSQWDKFKQGLNIGFIRYDNRLVVDIEECKIAEPALNEQIKHARAHPPPKGGIKTVLRVAPDGWEVPRDSFFQNNFYLLPRLVEAAGECLRGSGARFLIDAYCGVGFFSIELAGLVERFVGVELDQRAVQAARRNAAQRGITNGEFLMGEVEVHWPETLQRFEAGRTAVILDPPRTGCSAATLDWLRQSRPVQIIYVSCKPDTLARDLNILCSEEVFEVSGVVPLDMFPQTQHVECVADLRSKASAAQPR